MDKVRCKVLDNGSEVHGFRTLLHHMSAITRDRRRRHGARNSSCAFTIDTTPNEKPRRVLDRLGIIKAQAEACISFPPYLSEIIGNVCHLKNGTSD